MDHRDDPTAKGLRRRRLRFAGASPRTRSVVVATGLLVIGVTPFAAAATGDALREGQRNGTATKETEFIADLGSTTGDKGGYSTRQSNLSSSGGGAIYGCRSGAGGSSATPTPQNPCLRANNLSSGLAFEFRASTGANAGTISVGSGGDGTKPFTTNATGVATGLNADRVDGKHAADLQARFAQVAADGTVGASRGIITNSAGPAHVTGSYPLPFTGDLTKCAVSATITGTAFGDITATPALVTGNTVVTVLTADPAGTAADRAFALTVNC
jgi:hypothetical protein